MRVTRLAEVSIFENYSEHEFGIQLKALSDSLDVHPDILSLVRQGLIDESLKPVG
ncbi:MAG: IS5 family transposase [Enterobacterales bacterium]|jgi:IS5 family transposase